MYELTRKDVALVMAGTFVAGMCFGVAVATIGSWFF
jgi:hypothetical protein